MLLEGLFIDTVHAFPSSLPLLPSELRFPPEVCAELLSSALSLYSAVKVQIRNTIVLVFPRFHPKTGPERRTRIQAINLDSDIKELGEELRREGHVMRRAFLRVHCWASHHSGPIEVPTYWVSCVGCASELFLEGQRKEMKHCLMGH